MTIYVDEFPGGWGRWTGGGHLLCTDLEELHAMADKIGLKRAWFQDKRYPHYDVMKSKRALAIRNGAVQIGIGEIPDDVMMRVGDGIYSPRYDVMRKVRLRETLRDVRESKTQGDL